MEKRSSRTHWLACAAALCSVASGFAAPREVIRSAPPQPVEQSVTVQRGQSVEIPLRIYGTRAQTLSWSVRQPPAHGQLSAPRSTAQEAATITYTPANDPRFQSDRFTFSSRSNEGVSAPVEVRITIRDAEPRLSLPAALNFGAMLVGETAERTLEFTNTGGGIATGEVVVDAPWQVQGSARYRLAAGKSVALKLIFAPEKSGAFESDFRFTSQSDATCNLRGSAEEPLAVSPAQLTLTSAPESGVREGAFTVRNNTAAPLEVLVIGSQRLSFPATLTIEPHAQTEVLVRVADGDVEAVEETMRLAAGNVAARLPVTAAAMPARLSARPEAVRFRKVRPSGTQAERVVLENSGGAVAEIALTTSGPFSVQESWVKLNPKEQREVVINAGGSVGASAQGLLKATGSGFQLEVPLEVRGEEAPLGGEIIRASSRIPGVSRVAEVAAPPSVADVDETMVRPAFNRRIERDRAIFSWPGQLPTSGKLHCLLRTLALDGNGNLLTSFAEFPSCTFSQAGAEIAATVKKLAPGQIYFFRIDLEGAAGEPTTPLTFTSLRTRPPEQRAPIFTWFRLLLAGALACGGMLAWQRWRSRTIS